MCFGALSVAGQQPPESMDFLDHSPLSSVTSSDPSDSEPPTPSPEPVVKKVETWTLGQFNAKYGHLKVDAEVTANKEKFKVELEMEDDDVFSDASKRPDGTRRGTMTHDQVISASYARQIPYFQKFYIQESERTTMPRLASRAHQSLELRKTIGPIYETSTPCNSTAPMYFDFGPCPWMQDIKDTPKLDPVRENQRFIEKAQRMKAKQQEEQKVAERVEYGQRLLIAVMEKAAAYRGGLQEYLASLPQDEQLHILEAIAFNTQQAEKELKANAKANGRR